MALRVAGDPDAARPVGMLVDERQELDRGGERPGRRGRVAADDEGVVDLRPGHRTEQVVEVRAVPDHPRGEVHGDRVPGGAQARRDLDGQVRGRASASR